MWAACTGEDAIILILQIKSGEAPLEVCRTPLWKIAVLSGCLSCQDA